MNALLSRRTFLQRAPIAAAAIATPVTIAVAEAQSEPIEDSDMKCMRLARELFNAMKAHYGEGCTMVRNEVDGSLLFVPPPPPPRMVEFSGAGWYEVEDGTPDRVEVMWIEPTDRSDAMMGRLFRASPKDTDLHTRYYFEDWFRQIAVRKIGG
ncbi:hypothetical protein IHQ71_04195 [Rhizobium sp. TH2]|uniref:hypothetical protein n=1 Tax=Rhizobium sp. TH2 TaxID=2775403 RepID=UPI0021576F2F|nr:hypothetical protein [Rhizobium sp. TH2]UVC09822.1 hypothetical protein IHQ71_04195 [Rhizobium sp. TH2]